MLGMTGKAFLLLFLALSFPFFGSAGERYALKTAEVLGLLGKEVSHVAVWYWNKKVGEAGIKLHQLSFRHDLRQEMLVNKGKGKGHVPRPHGHPP